MNVSTNRLPYTSGDPLNKTRYPTEANALSKSNLKISVTKFFGDKGKVLDYVMITAV